jgi:hypothetical protein
MRRGLKLSGIASSGASRWVCFKAIPDEKGTETKMHYFDRIRAGRASKETYASLHSDDALRLYWQT